MVTMYLTIDIYILIPIGINNLFPDNKPNKLCLIISWIYPPGLFAMIWYQYDSRNNKYFNQAGNSSVSWIVHLIFAWQIFNTIFVYCYIRWYFFRKRYHTFLMISLYEYITETVSNIKDGDHIIHKYYESIYKHCKYAMILHYVFMIILTIVWIFISQTAVYKEFSFSYNFFVLSLYVYQGWWINTVGVIIFIVNLKLLQLRYYAFTAKLCATKEYNDLLQLDELQQVYQNDDENVGINGGDIMLKNVKEISNEYLNVAVLFQRNCNLWTIFLIIKGIWLFVTTLFGFVIIYIGVEYKSGDRTRIGIEYAFAIWFCTMWLIIAYFIGMANLNQIPDNFTQLITICYVWINHNFVNQDDHESIMSADILYLLQLSETNRCSFKVMNIELSMGMTIVLCTSGLAPVIAYLAQWYINSLNIG